METGTRQHLGKLDTKNAETNMLIIQQPAKNINNK